MDLKGFRPVQALTAAQAVSLVDGGALVAVDSCGDGCAGIDWLTPAERRSAARRGMLLKRRGQGRIERWDGPDGQVAVVVIAGDLRR